MMKEYGHLLHDDPAWASRAAACAARVRDVTELLAGAGPRPGGSLAHRVTNDAPCHLVHCQRVDRPPRAVLARIPNLTLVPLTDADQCCGSAGIYNLLQPDLSLQVLAPKLANIAATGADFVATGNPGCLMHIGAGLLRSGLRTRVVHPVDLLDASYAAAAP
jgi:glycolate oxidase iron-sulfur subunit